MLRFRSRQRFLVIVRRSDGGTRQFLVNTTTFLERPTLTLARVQAEETLYEHIDWDEFVRDGETVVRVQAVLPHSKGSMMTTSRSG